MGFEIRDFFKAGNPLIFVPTIEYTKAEEAIREALKEAIGKDKDGNQKNMHQGFWKVTVGLMVGDLETKYPPRRRGERDDDYAERIADIPQFKEPDLRRDQQADELGDALAYLEVRDEPMLLLLYNVRQFIENPVIIQAIIDAAYAAKRKGSHIVILGPQMDLPPEIKNLITVCPYPLPTQNEITTHYKRIAKLYKKSISLSNGEAWARKGNNDEKKKLLDVASRAACGLDLFGAENAIALSIAREHAIVPEIIQSHKRQEVNKNDVLEYVDFDESLDTIGGFGNLKEWVKRRERVFTQEARDYGLSYPKGILITGVSGTGKSLAAKAVANFLQLPLLRMDMGKIFRQYVGTSEAAIRSALQTAEAVSPCILHIDEIEKGMAGYKSSGDADSGVSARVMGTLLTWRQETQSAVMVVATANNVDSLPPEALRKGRFDVIWFCGLPQQEEREEIYRIHIKKRGRDPGNYDTALLAKKSNGFVGAEIEAVVEAALVDSFFENRELETSDILDVIDDTKPQSDRDSESVKRILEWGEKSAIPVAKQEKRATQKTKIRHLRSVDVDETEPTEEDE